MVSYFVLIYERETEFFWKNSVSFFFNLNLYSPTMTLLHPIWLLLLIPLIISLRVWRLPSRFLGGLRIAILALILLAMCGLAVKLPSRAGTVVVVADRSQSMPSDSEERQKEAIDLIQDAMGRDANLAVVSFGRDVAVEQAPQSGNSPGSSTKFMMTLPT